SVGALVGASDASAKLIQLGEAQTVSSIDEDGVGAGDVEPVLHNSGRDQNVGFVADELQHHRLKLFFPHLAVADDNTSLRDEFAHQTRQRIDGLDAVVDEVDLTRTRQLVFDGAAYQFLAERLYDGLNGQPVARRRFDH